MVTVLAGANNFMLRMELAKIIQAFVAQYGDMAFEQLDGEEVSYERMAEAVQSLPFLVAKKLVVLRTPSVNKQFMEQAETLLSDVPETTDVVLVEPKLDKRTAYHKWLKQHTAYKEYDELDARRLASWVVQFAKEQGSSISLSDAAYLIDAVGTDQQLLSNEICKLVLAGTKITRDTIHQLTEPMPQSKIFDLLDAAFSGQTKKALELYAEQRRLKVEPQEILAMLGWQLRQVALAKTAGTKHDLIKEGKVSSYSARKAQVIARRLTLERLKNLVHDLVLLDARSKRQSIDLDEALQAYIMQITV